MNRSEFYARRRAYRTWLHGGQPTGYYTNTPRNSSAWQRGDKGTWVSLPVPGLSDLCDSKLSEAIRARPSTHNLMPRQRTWTRKNIIALAIAQSRAHGEKLRRQRMAIEAEMTQARG